jgi:triosephosphate isomerase
MEMWSRNAESLYRSIVPHNFTARAPVTRVCPRFFQVLVGHSERRSVFGASDELINKQMHKALADGLKPLLCIGETKTEYEAGLNTMVCAMQLSKGLQGLSKEQMKQAGATA